MPTLSHQLQLICLIHSSHLNCNSGIRINLDEDSSGLSVGETLTPFGFTYYVHGWPRSSCVKMQIILHGNTFVALVLLLRIVSLSLFFCLSALCRAIFPHFSIFPFFMSQVSECNWPSRQAPSLHNLFAVCKNMHNWLKQNPKNVCVITCSVRKNAHTVYWLHFALFCHCWWQSIDVDFIICK